jgi:DNA-binding transcriptional ArsR family regulator
VPRAPTTSDVFNAIAEPRRRELLKVLARGGEFAVGELGEELGLPQPAVSKHLGVLREVGVVAVSKEGRRRMYRLEASQLRPVYDWIRTFERFWTHQLDRVKERAEAAAGRRAVNGTPESERKDDPC